MKKKNLKKTLDEVMLDNEALLTELSKAVLERDMERQANKELRSFLAEISSKDDDFNKKLQEVEDAVAAWMFNKEEADNKLKALEQKLEDEKEVGIRARKLYNAFQSDVYPSLTLEQKARNLYVYVERMTDRTLTEASLERGIDLETQLSEEFDALPVDQKEEMMEIFLSITGVKFNS